MRRGAGLAGLGAAAGLLVAAKAAGAPPHRTVVLGPPHAPAAPAPAAPSGRPRSPDPPGAAPSSGGGRAGPVTAAPRTVLGAAVYVGYGTVQVRLTLAAGRIVDAAAIRLPQGGRSSDISAYAAPQLRAEVLSAQSANIDAVSGASYTSSGYARSVQAALDTHP